MARTQRPTRTLRDLVEKGLVQPVKLGRPPIYKTDEERKAAHREQQRACVKRHAARVKEALARMKTEGCTLQDLCVQAD